jgi:small ubiquitin-related modifier
MSTVRTNQPQAEAKACGLLASWQRGQEGAGLNILELPQTGTEAEAASGTSMEPPVTIAAPPAAKPPSETITVRVKDQAGEETFFKVKLTTKMGKVIAAYANRKGVQQTSLRFLLDGERINDEDTPKTLELEDRDQIDCLLEQYGGSGKKLAFPETTDDLVEQHRMHKRSLKETIEEEKRLLAKISRYTTVPQSLDDEKAEIQSRIRWIQREMKELESLPKVGDIYQRKDPEKDGEGLGRGKAHYWGESYSGCWVHLVHLWPQEKSFQRGKAYRDNMQQGHKVQVLGLKQWLHKGGANYVIHFESCDDGKVLHNEETVSRNRVYKTDLCKFKYYMELVSDGPAPKHLEMLSRKKAEAVVESVDEPVAPQASSEQQLREARKEVKKKAKEVNALHIQLQTAEVKIKRLEMLLRKKAEAASGSAPPTDKVPTDKHVWFTWLQALDDDFSQGGEECIFDGSEEGLLQRSIDLGFVSVWRVPKCLEGTDYKLEACIGPVKDTTKLESKELICLRFNKHRILSVPLIAKHMNEEQRKELFDNMISLLGITKDRTWLSEELGEELKRHDQRKRKAEAPPADHAAKKRFCPSTM